MVNQKELLDILNRERDFEERIVKNIFDYINYSLDETKGLSEEEKEEIKRVLSILGHESSMHQNMFTELVNECIGNGEIN